MKSTTSLVPLTKLKPNPDNPRVLKDDKFQKLVASLETFPNMLELRPIVVDETWTVLGGNMRLRALQHLKVKEVPVTQVEGLTQEQKKEFIIKDNANFGEWDWEVLANEWDAAQLEDWGLDVWVPSEEPDLDKFFETVDEEKEGRFRLVLDYTEADYHTVIELFNNHTGSREDVVLRLLQG